MRTSLSVSKLQYALMLPHRQEPCHIKLPPPSFYVFLMESGFMPNYGYPPDKLSDTYVSRTKVSWCGTSQTGHCRCY